MEVWKEQGVPLETVLRGIDRAFSKARREIGTLGYCVGAVAQVVEEEKNTRVERPDIPDMPAEETQRYLENTASQVLKLSERFPEFAGKFAGIADAVRTVDAADLRNTELTLTALEDRLIALLKVASEERALVAVQQEVDTALRPFRSTMTAPQLAALEQQLQRRMILEAADAPRLSLFYLI